MDAWNNNNNNNLVKTINNFVYMEPMRHKIKLWLGIPLKINNRKNFAQKKSNECFGNPSDFLLLLYVPYRLNFLIPNFIDCHGTHSNFVINILEKNIFHYYFYSEFA